jgi:hypothetical protein
MSSFQKLAAHSLLGLVLCFAFVSSVRAESVPKLSASCIVGWGPNCQRELQFVGTIEPGDAKLIESSILNAPGFVSSVWFNSPGGDVFEAIKIGDLLNKYFIEMRAPTCFAQNEKLVCMLGAGLKEFDKRAICASACALVYLVSNDRSGHHVYVHRPSFPQSMFAGLTAPKAKEKYEEAMKRTTALLQERGVDSETLKLISNTPSDELKSLPTPLPDRTAWLEEWITAKCEDKLTASQMSKLDQFSLRQKAHQITGQKDSHFKLSAEEEAEMSKLEVIEMKHFMCAQSALNFERKRAQKK